MPNNVEIAGILARLKGRVAATSSLSALSLCLAWGALTVSTPAYAQSADEPAAEDEVAAAAPDTDVGTEAGRADDSGMILVTGSRAAASGFNSPTPTTVIGGDLLERQNIANIAQALNEFPAFKASLSPNSNGSRPTNPGAAPADLRGLGPQRTLVLVNGVRAVPQATASTTSTGLSPDLNQIPAIMIQRVEVVTGGASAQWGSDAVAGVVNVLLKDRYEGLEITAMGGQSTRDDFHEYRIAGLGGVNFADGRGNVMVAVDYNETTNPAGFYDRDWTRDEWQIVSNANHATNGRPALILSPNVHVAAARGGVIVSPTNFSLNGMQFLPDGSLTPFDGGTLNNGVFQIGGEGRVSADGATLAPSVRRINPYARVSFDASDAAQLYVEASYPHSHAEVIGFNPRDYSLTVRNDNAFLPDEVRDAMAAESITSLRIARTSYDTGPTYQTLDNRALRFVAGGQGELGGGWHWDAHYSWSKNTFESALDNDRLRKEFAWALDSVLSNGTPVCRATLPGSSFDADAAGCVPFNPFGDGAASLASQNYITRSHSVSSVYHQDNVAANVRGEPFSTWAGAVSMATGVEYRRESQVVITDEIAANNGYQIGNGGGFEGSFDVIEGYLETIVPLARDISFARSFDVNAAIRFAEYSTAGSQTTWKVGATYEPIDGIRLRVTRSRDIRAPAITELFSPGSSTNSTLTVLGKSGAVLANVTLGNPALRPERGDTLAVGVVLEPGGALSGLRASVDYYDINLKDAITSLPSGNVASLCNLGQQVFCDRFTFANDGTPLTLVSPITNAGGIQTSGVDFALSYRTGMPQWFGDEPHNLSLSLSGTYVEHSWVDLGVGTGRIDRAGENGQTNLAALPHLRANMSATYEAGPAQLTAQVMFVGKGTRDNTYNTTPATTINDNSVSAMAYLNLFAQYDINERLTVFGSLRNALDQDPPPIPYTTILVPTNGTYYDIVGRAFQVGFTARF